MLQPSGRAEFPELPLDSPKDVWHIPPMAQGRNRLQFHKDLQRELDVGMQGRTKGKRGELPALSCTECNERYTKMGQTGSHSSTRLRGGPSEAEQRLLAGA